MPPINKRCSAVLRGVSHEGKLIGEGAHDQEPDGDTRRRDSDLDRFGPSDRRNNLRPMSLVYCIEYEIYGCTYLATRGPLPLLIYSGGVGLQGKYPISYYTMACGARRARLDLVGWATSDGAAHVLLCGYRGSYPHS